MASRRDVRRYRQRLFRSDVETIGALMLILGLIWICTSAPLIAIPDRVKAMPVSFHGVTARLVGQP